MNESTVVSKVRKLMALAGNNPSREEAESAMMKAQALLAEHGLAMADVEGAECGSRSAEESMVGEAGKQATWWRKRIASIVAKNFRCAVYYRHTWESSKGNYRITLVGLPEDVAIASSVFELACTTAKREKDKHSRGLSAEHRNDSSWSRADTRASVHDFLRGYVEGLEEAFARNVAETCTALVLVQPKAVKDHMAGLNLRQASASRVSTRGDSAAMERGRERGRAFNHRPKLR